jgi:two-component system phosphate regulon sensor histidine kinase PhoR
VRFHETLFDSLPSPIFLLDGQRRLVGENKAARKAFGRQQRGRDLAAVIRQPDLLDAVDAVLTGDKGSEIEFALPGPVDWQYRAMLEPLAEQGADGTAAVLSLHDITALKHIERLRADFVANASHELRTPLATVLGFIETLRGPARDDSDAREKFLGIMYEQATRMSRLVADLLTLSRIEMHEHTMPQGEVDIAAVLRRVAAGLEMRAVDRDMRIELDLNESLPPVTGVENELEQVFQNLMDNALKYGRGGTPVEVVATLAEKPPTAMHSREGPVLAVTVRDHGEGISRENLPRLTERFFRVDTARSRQLGGTGLGLAIVKHVVNRHRGALVIDSHVGAGSSFSVFLPLG